MGNCLQYVRPYREMEFRAVTLEELIAAYETAAVLHGDAFAKGDLRTSNRAADKVAAIYRELRQRGDGARMALLPLLLASHSWVRGWAAAHALEFAPEMGRVVLEALSTEEGMIGFSARMTLTTWRKGELKFP